jgi:hypothetical protein
MPADDDLIRALTEEISRAQDRGDTERALALQERLASLKAGTGSRLRRQEPGAMGLGSSQEVPRRPAGWKPPKRPDPMTTGRRR